MFTLALAIGILLVPGNNLDALEAALFGDISQVTIIDAATAIAQFALAAIFLTKLIYKKLVLAMISEDLAISKGIKVALTNSALPFPCFRCCRNWHPHSWNITCWFSSHSSRNSCQKLKLLT